MISFDTAPWVITALKIAGKPLGPHSIHLALKYLTSPESRAPLDMTVSSHIAPITLLHGLDGNIQPSDLVDVQNLFVSDFHQKRR